MEWIEELASPQLRGVSGLSLSEDDPVALRAQVRRLAHRVAAAPVSARFGRSRILGLPGHELTNSHSELTCYRGPGSTFHSSKSRDVGCQAQRCTAKANDANQNSNAGACRCLRYTHRYAPLARAVVAVHRQWTLFGPRL